MPRGKLSEKSAFLLQLESLRSSYRASMNKYIIEDHLKMNSMTKAAKSLLIPLQFKALRSGCSRPIIKYIIDDL